ncbi:uncharacterized protein BDV17DRAFT_130790 [Aspergillus undulatus]|uniref:uncharacterized protein n=1 Tax=Aspergillus undulatus TaxID=1810928 RepID=UPI003CCE4352
MIYRDIFVSSTPVHVWRTHRRLCSIPCPLNPGLTPAPCLSRIAHHSMCRPPFARDGSVQRRPGSGWTSRKRSGTKFLPMLSTCRRMYTETIDLLYTRNKFVIEDQAAFLLLPTLMPSHRFKSIRYLDLRFNAFRNDEVLRKAEVSWKQFCQTLAGMPRLEDLCIALACHLKDPHINQPGYKLPLATFLTPLTKVRAKKFLVQIPPGCNLTEVIGGDEQTFSIEIQKDLLEGCYCCPFKYQRDSSFPFPPSWGL